MRSSSDESEDSTIFRVRDARGGFFFGARLYFVAAEGAEAIAIEAAGVVGLVVGLVAGVAAELGGADAVADGVAADIGTVGGVLCSRRVASAIVTPCSICSTRYADGLSPSGLKQADVDRVIGVRRELVSWRPLPSAELPLVSSAACCPLDAGDFTASGRCMSLPSGCWSRARCVLVAPSGTISSTAWRPLRAGGVAVSGPGASLPGWP